MASMTVIGSYISPYVRKVLVFLEARGSNTKLIRSRHSRATRRSRD
jgi:glutathione S-transferase